MRTSGNERGAPLTAARHNRGLSTDANRTYSLSRSASDCPECAASRPVNSGALRSNRFSAHRLGERCRLASAPDLPESLRDKRAKSYRAHRTRIRFVVYVSSPMNKPMLFLLELFLLPYLRVFKLNLLSINFPSQELFTNLS